MTALGLIWLSGIAQAEPLKHALFDSDQYPAKILRPPPPFQVIQKPQRNTKKVVVTNVLIDLRQVHVHAPPNTEDSQTTKPEPKPARHGKSDLNRPWLTDVEAERFPDLLREFKRYLPDHLAWIAVVIENAAPLLEKNPGWSQSKILTELLKKFETLKQWTDLTFKSQRDTIEKIFYRSRNDKKYVWVGSFLRRQTRGTNIIMKPS
jgi:hypothetical protein